MAFATWNADVESGGTVANATSTVITLPASRAVGDRVCAWLCIDQTGLGTWPTGWIKLFALTADSALRLEFAYRDWTGSETGPQGSGGTISVSHASNMASWIAAYVDAGTYHTGTAPAVATATGTGGSPDPPSLDPAGWGTEDTLWVAVCGHDDGTTTFSTPNPTGYTALADARGDNSQSTGVAVAWKNAAAASEHPGLFTLSNNEVWAAATIGIRPAAAAVSLIWHPRTMLAHLGR